MRKSAHLVRLCLRVVGEREIEEIGEEAVDQDSERGVHPHCNGKSPEASENTGVAALYCAKESGSRWK
jgi:hypothetical protein